MAPRRDRAYGGRDSPDGLPLVPEELAIATGTISKPQVDLTGNDQDGESLSWHPVLVLSRGCAEDGATAGVLGSGVAGLPHSTEARLERQFNLRVKLDSLTPFPDVHADQIAEGLPIRDEIAEMARALVPLIIDLRPPLHLVVGLEPSHVPREHHPRCCRITGQSKRDPRVDRVK